MKKTIMMHKKDNVATLMSDAQAGGVILVVSKSGRAGCRRLWMASGKIAFLARELRLGRR